MVLLIQYEVQQILIIVEDVCYQVISKIFTTCIKAQRDQANYIISKYILLYLNIIIFVIKQY